MKDAHATGTHAGNTARREAGALYFKNRRIGVFLPPGTLAGRTFRELYHKPKDLKKLREKSYFPRGNFIGRGLCRARPDRFPLARLWRFSREARPQMA